MRKLLTAILPAIYKYKKTLLTALTLLLMVFYLWPESKHPDYQSTYNRYYDYYYAEYRKTMNDSSAKHYARYYADYYASYFTSDAYRNALQQSLPEATAENMAYPSVSKVAELTTSRMGVALIRYFEGLRLKPYLDSGGKMTIGYGHLLRNGEFYSQISKQQADEMLTEDIKVAEAVVKRHVLVDLNQQQFSALVSLVYNIGEGQFKNSTLLKELNSGNLQQAGDEFLRWKHVNGQEIRGLKRRRMAERLLFAGKT